MGLQPLIFDDFAPDLDTITSGACQDMDGVFPVEKGFRTLPALALVASGLPSTCFGIFNADLLGTPTTVAGTANGLYVNVNGVFRPDVAGLANTANRWRFAGYGQDIVAVDGVDAAYYYRLSNGNWQLLPGSPPIASLVESTDWAVILVPPNSQTIWSNLSDTAPWVANLAAQVYEINLDTIPGVITAVHRSRSLLGVYRQKAIQCGTFVGGQIGWDFGQPGTISLSVGVAGNECVVNTGDFHYFVGPDDFWQFDGYNLGRVPNHCKEFFFRDLNQDFIANIAGRYDVLRDLVVWHYPSTASEIGALDSYIGFYQRTGKWFFGRRKVELPLPTPVPDPLHRTTTPDSGLVLPDHNLYVYDDLNPQAIVSGVFITSNDFGDRQSVWQTRRVRPGFTQYPTPAATGAPPARVTPLNQMMLNGVPPVNGTPVVVSDDGWANLMNTARLQRFRIDMYGTAELAAGTVDLLQGGEV